MKTAYLVNHNNGADWEDNFEHTISVHTTEEAAKARIDQYVKWEEELSKVDFLDMRCKLEERLDDSESDEYNEMVLNQIEISMTELINGVLDDLGITGRERDRYESFEDWDGKHYYNIEEAILYL